MLIQRVKNKHWTLTTGVCWSSSAPKFELLLDKHEFVKMHHWLIRQGFTGWSCVIFYNTALCWSPSVNVKQSLSRTSRNISFKGEKESRILHGERQSGANESQQECNAVWLILGSLSAWFYWEKWDDDRWISELTAGVEGWVIVVERRRVFSVSRNVSRGQSIRAFVWTLRTRRLRCVRDTKPARCKRPSQESRLFLCHCTGEVVTVMLWLDDADSLSVERKGK